MAVTVRFTSESPELIAVGKKAPPRCKRTDTDEPVVTTEGAPSYWTQSTYVPATMAPGEKLITLSVIWVVASVTVAEVAAKAPCVVDAAQLPARSVYTSPVDSPVPLTMIGWGRSVAPMRESGSTEETALPTVRTVVPTCTKALSP